MQNIKCSTHFEKAYKEYKETIAQPKLLQVPGGNEQGLQHWRILGTTSKKKNVFTEGKRRLSNGRDIEDKMSLLGGKGENEDYSKDNHQDSLQISTTNVDKKIPILWKRELRDRRASVNSDLLSPHHIEKLNLKHQRKSLTPDCFSQLRLISAKIQNERRASMDMTRVYDSSDLTHSNSNSNNNSNKNTITTTTSHNKNNSNNNINNNINSNCNINNSSDSSDTDDCQDSFEQCGDECSNSLNNISGHSRLLVQRSRRLNVVQVKQYSTDCAKSTPTTVERKSMTKSPLLLPKIEPSYLVNKRHSPISTTTATTTTTTNTVTIGTTKNDRRNTRAKKASKKSKQLTAEVNVSSSNTRTTANQTGRTKEISQANSLTKSIGMAPPSSLSSTPTSAQRRANNSRRRSFKGGKRTLRKTPAESSSLSNHNLNSMGEESSDD